MPVFELTDVNGNTHTVTALTEGNAIKAVQWELDNPTPENRIKGALQAIGSGVVSAPFGIMTIPQGTLRLADWAIDKAKHLVNPSAPKGQEFFGDIIKKGAKALNPDMPEVKGSAYGVLDKGRAGYREALNLHEPVNKEEGLADLGAEIATSFAAPGAIAGRPLQAAREIATMGIPSAIGTIAPRVTPGIKGTALEDPLSIAGGILAPMATGTALSLRRPEAWAARNLKGVTQQQLDAAEALQARPGPRLLASEAIQAAAKGGSGIGDAARIIEGTDRGGQVIKGFLAPRPLEQDRFARATFDRIAPTSATPSMAGVAVKKGAEKAIDTARQAVNTAADPFYSQLVNETMPAAEYARLAGNNAYKAALADIRRNKILESRYAHLPDDNMAVVNATIKRLGSMADDWKPNPLKNGGDRETYAAIVGAKTTADSIADAASSNRANARNTVRTGSERFVDPLKSGPLGAMSATDDVQAQAKALFGAASEKETGRASSWLDRTAPAAVKSVVRQGIEEPFNASQKGNPNPPAPNRPSAPLGPNSDLSGALFARKILDNTQKAENILTAVERTAGPEAAKALSDLLDNFRATGWRMPVGSRTAFNATAIADDLSGGGLSSLAKATWNPFKSGTEWVAKKALGRNSERLAEILVHPEGVTKLRAMAAKLQDTPIRDALVSALAQTGPRRQYSDKETPKK